MSKVVDEAIAAVTAGVKRLAKDEKNQHGGYQFAGIDDFLEMTGKLCGAAGLNVLMDETEMEILPEFFTTKAGKVSGLRMKFAICLASQGEQIGPFHRSIIVPANMGSQAFGAGQSYVLKQFLRATFQIPTGDKGEDIDAHDTGAMTPQKPQQFKPQGRTILSGPIKTKTALSAAAKAFMAQAAGMATPEAMDVFMEHEKALIEQIKAEFPGWWDGSATKEAGMDEQISQIYTKLAGDNHPGSLIDDQIPY